MQRNYQTIHTYLTCFQNESISIQKTYLLVWCLHCLYRYSKTSNAFSPLCIFELKVMFRYHFLSHFWQNWKNLLWIIIEWYSKNVQNKISLKHSDFFLFSKIRNFVEFFLGFSHKKWLKMYYATKVKTLLYVSSFVCLLCVCNFSLHLKKRF